MDGSNLLAPEHPAVMNGLINRDGTPVVAQEAAAPEIVAEPSIEQPIEPVAPVREEVQESSEERNFRNLRNKADKLQRERDEAFARLKAYETPDEPDYSMAPNELAEGKHINKVQSKIQELESQVIESRLRSQYPDIDSVVSADNLAVLQRDYPDLANTIGSSRNLYSKAVSAYTILKKLGISGGQTPYEQEKAIAHKNALKPKPLASMTPQQGDSPLSHANAFANGLTDDLKKSLQREMAQAMKNR